MRNYLFQYPNLSQFLFIFSVILFVASDSNSSTTVKVFPNSVTNELINGNPIGLNLAWFMTDEEEIQLPIENMNIGVLRFPFGHMADNYLWDMPPWPKSKGDGITPQIASPKKVPALGTAKWVNKYVKSKNEFYSNMDIDGFMSLSKKTGSTPLISVNYLSQYYPGGPTKQQLIDTAKEWVRYANITNDYNIKYWSIGNEVDHHVKLGYTKEDYAKDFKLFAKAMKEVDPSIKVGAAANNWLMFLAQALNDEADYLVAHQYGRMHLDYAFYRDHKGKLVKSVWRAGHAIRKFPKKNGKKWEIVVSEYSGFFAGKKGGSDQKNDLWKALLTADMTGTIISRPSVSLSTAWAARSPFGDPESIHNSANFLGPNYEITPFGFALKLFGNNMQDKMIRTNTTSKLISTYGSVNEKSNLATVWLINKNQKPESITIELGGYAINKCQSTEWVSGGADPWALMPNVKYEKKPCEKLAGRRYQTTMPPVSMAAIVLEIRPDKRAGTKSKQIKFKKNDLSFIEHKPTGFKLGSCGTKHGEPVTAEPASSKGDCVLWSRKKSGEFFFIHNKHSGMSIRPKSIIKDAPLILAIPTIQNNWTQWRLEPRENGFGHLINRQTGKHLFIAGENEGGQVTQAPASWRGDYTQWKFTPAN